MPEISVIIPTYNRAKYLEQLLDTILEMNGISLEIIIINDNSTDATDSMIRNKYSSYNNIRYVVNQTNEGCGKSRRKGLELSRGNYIVFADDDDYYIDDNFYKKGVEILRNSQNIACVSGNSKLYYNKGNRLTDDSSLTPGLISGPEFLNGFMSQFQKPRSTFSTIFRKEALIKSGLLESQMVNDASIYMRALIYGDIFTLKEHIGVYRIHDHNISNNLSSSFIIENLKEKSSIYKLAKEQDLHLNPKWLHQQFNLTISYYFNNNQYTAIDFIKIIKWGVCNNALNLKSIFKLLPLIIKKK